MRENIDENSNNHARIGFEARQRFMKNRTTIVITPNSKDFIISTETTPWPTYSLKGRQLDRYI